MKTTTCNKKEVVIIGGGAAGMLAAISAKTNHVNYNVSIFEGNEKLGKKLYITGKGRCNITNACDVEDLFKNIITNPKFLYSAFYTFNNDSIVEMLNEGGVQTKIERGNRIFPVSDKAVDVINALKKKIYDMGINVYLNTKIINVQKDDEDNIKNVITQDKNIIKCDYLIVATGGNSYQTTGSTGDGYNFARNLGHTVTEITPALVPIVLKEEEAKQLQGLSLKNVETTIYYNVKEKKKVIFKDQGEMIFTHFGVSGPLILSASSYISKAEKKAENESLILNIDLKPALTIEQLDKRILRDFSENINRNFNNSLDKLLPKKLIPIIIKLSGIDEYKKVNEISKEDRERLVYIIKNLKFTIVGLRGFNEAIITQGGINVKEVNSSNMESKIVKGLYFAGEVLDLDAVTGGFNLQIAWSTAWLAGMLE